MIKNLLNKCDDDLVLTIYNHETLYNMRFDLGRFELELMGFKFTDKQYEIFQKRVAEDYLEEEL